MTYSFPCTDLSIAGQGLARKDGLKKGSATRSGLLWEVERLLNELGTELPQILLMENVPQVATTEGFADWCNFLKSKGYINHWQILNAKNYGVAQNRERCFMISILSPDYVDFTFPSPVKLEKTVRDYLEPTVDEKYYINTEKAQKLLFELSDTIIAEQNRTEQNRTDCSNVELICQQTVLDLKTSQTVLQSDMMQGFANTKTKEQESLKLIPAKLNKPYEDGQFRKMNEIGVCDIGTPIASTVTSHYWRGLSCHKDNLVIEIKE